MSGSLRDLKETIDFIPFFIELYCQPNAPREGRGVPLQRQNLKIFLVS